MLQVRLQPGFRQADVSTALGSGTAGHGCRKGTGHVAQAVFAKLGDLDPGQHRRPARTRGDVHPGRDRIVVPPEPPEQVGPIHGDATRVPGRREGGPSCPGGPGR
jgi:hypothetical protein